MCHVCEFSCFKRLNMYLPIVGLLLGLLGGHLTDWQEREGWTGSKSAESCRVTDGL